LALAASGATSALAQTNYVWTGGGNNSEWNNGSNWTNGVPSSSYENTLTFDGSTRTTNNNNLGDWTLTVGKLEFASNASAFTLTGNAFGFNPYPGVDENQIFQTSAATQAIAVDQLSFRYRAFINPGPFDPDFFSQTGIYLDAGDLVISSRNVWIDSASETVGQDFFIGGADTTRRTLTLTGNVGKGGASTNADPLIFVLDNKRLLVTGTVNLGEFSEVRVISGVVEVGGAGSIANGLLQLQSDVNAQAAVALNTAGSSFSRSIDVSNLDPADNARNTIAGLNTSGTVSYAGDIFISGNNPDNLTDFVAATGGSVLFSGTYRDLRYGNIAINRPDGGTSYGGTVILSQAAVNSDDGDNPAPGYTTLYAGTLQISDFDQLGTAQLEFNASSGDSGTLRYTGGSTTTTKTLYIDNSGITRAAIDVSDPATVLTWNPGSSNLATNVTKSGAGTLSFGGPITGAATVGVEGGTLILTVSNNFTGGVTLSAGTLALGSANALGSSGTISFGGGSLQYSASNTTDYSGRFSNAAGQQYSVDTNGQNVTLGSNLTSSGGSFMKLGSGILTLSGANSYSGGTTVTAGRLSVNGSLGATAVTVQNAAELGGAGSIAGALAILAGGTLSPGNSIESLAAGATTFSGSSTFAYEYDSTNPGSLAAAADLLVVSGNLTIDPGTILTLTDLAGTPNAFVNYTTTFALINYSGTWNNGLFTYNGVGLPNGSRFFLGSQEWQIDYDRTSPTGLANYTGDYLPSSSFVTITAVPEPSTYAMALAGLACGGYSMFRRRKRA
jgi:autotransporter-associated beta strand protein